MVKRFLFLILFAGVFFSAIAQPASREELEKQRLQLKKEIEQTEKLLKENRAKTQESFVTWKLATDKMNLQDKVIDNINKDINLLDNNIYTIQRDINKYDRMLDTLKQEYAKSMIYAYKNRSDYDFLNFLFSAKNFNDALKRLAYLKSYRMYREMQGENILRTQELRKKRLEETTGVKVKKNFVLDNKSKELQTLEKQKIEQDRILGELKKKGSQINAQYAAKKNQMSKVSNAIAAAIAKAKKEAIAKAAAEEKKKAAEEKKKQEEIKRLAALNKPKTNPAKPNTNITTKKTPEVASIKPLVTKKEPVKNVLLNADNINLNTSFEKNKGSLPWPVDKGYVLMHFGDNKLPSGTIINQKYLTLGTDIGASVKAIFDGTVSSVFNVEDMQVVMIQHGRYFTSYSNLSGVTVQKNQTVKMGQVIGKVMANFDGIGAVDLIMSTEKSDFDPQSWLRRR
ncbi:MAG: peptidoglycan DD-metalloendopeptidase family protein [Chitinophagaceae bacterium]|nr:peptidoglycan DD-metalloendopeptidase family protein [Chitinophagaceae bacterium]